MMSDEEDDVGIKFNPDDVELIRDYLIPKIKNEPCGDDGEYIVSKDVYAKEPWLLDHKNKDNFFKEDEWFYYATRTQVSKLKTGRGKNSKRTIINGGGYWKANDGEKEIKDETGETIGMKEKLKFINNTASTTCVDNRWIMQEYKLADGDKFQQLVLCKIYKKKEKKSNKKDEAIATRDQEEELALGSDKDDQVYPNPPPASSSLQRQEGQGQDSLQHYSDLDYTAWINQEPINEAHHSMIYGSPYMLGMNQGEFVPASYSQQQTINYSSPSMSWMNQEAPVPASYSQQQSIIYSSPYMLGMNQEESAPVFSLQQQPINEDHHSMIYGSPCMPWSWMNQEEFVPASYSQHQ